MTRIDVQIGLCQSGVVPIADAVKLLEMPEHDAVSVIVYADDDELMALGERINARWDLAYMNGYNWEALIHAFIKMHDPELEAFVQPDPEAGMYSGVVPYSAANVERMRGFERLIQVLIADEAALFDFIEANDIPWD